MNMLFNDIKESFINDSQDYITPNSNCIYYNTSRHNFLSDTDEGISQNLLLNFIQWIILIVLFSILRKRAGNYGRIALVQQYEENIGWGQLFYGGVEASSNDATSISSTDSAAYDEGRFSWVSAIFLKSQDDVLKKCGKDAAQYLLFQRHIICFMFIMMCTSLCIVLPVNFQGELEGDKMKFGHTTVSNLSPDSPLLWVHVTLSILYLPLVIIIMRRFSLHARIQEVNSNSSKTIMITKIPRRYCDSEDIRRHFREVHPELNIQEIQLAFNITCVSKLEKRRGQAFLAKQYCERHLHNTNTRLEMRPYVCGLVCGCCDMCGCPKVDAIEFYTEEEERLSEAVSVAQREALKRPLGIAFLTMETVEDAKALFLLKRYWHRRNLSTLSSLSLQLNPKRWRVSFAPSSDDIFWENLSTSSRFWYIRAFTINIILFLVLFFLTTPAYIVNLLSTIPLTDAIQTINPVFSQFVPTLILWTVAALLPVLVSYSDQWLYHWTRSEQNYAIMIKTFAFLILMVLTLPSIGLTSAKAFVDWTLHIRNETYRWECLFLPDKGAFFVNYVITSTFIGTALELIRFPELFVYAVRICLARSRAETSSVRKAILWEFSFGVQYAWMLLIFAMTTVYSLSCPLITPFGLLYMLLKHAVDKHNLLFVYKPSKISSEIHATAINCVVFSVMLVQASFLGLSLLRRGFNDISTYALLGFLLTILFFLFNVFFSCCKGFSAFSYVINQESSLPNSPTRESNSRWFVPDVLNINSSEPLDESRGPRTYGTQAPDINIIPEVGNSQHQDVGAPSIV